MARVPLLLLLAYGCAFGAVALGVSTPAFDDHPGQLYRLWHVVTQGPAPWAWNAGWWTGYPELQFYPPAFADAGAALHALSLGVVSVPAAYQALLWLSWLAPGVTVFVALARLLGQTWLALPGAFVALTLSLWPAFASGVEGGVHVGMAPARLGWALLALLPAALGAWSRGAGAFPAGAVVPLAAAIVLVHPAHLPAAVVAVGLAALGVAPRRRRLGVALAWLVVAALVTAFWTLPLLARVTETRALAWGSITLSAAHLPLVSVLTALALFALVRARSAAERVVAWLPWAMGLVVALDARALAPLGLRWLPADRVLDSAWLGLVLAGGLGAGRLVERLAERRALPLAAAALAAVALTIAVALTGDRLLAPVGTETLTLWPRTSAWPTQPATERGFRLPALWGILREAPSGRALFVRSSVPLVYGTEWWRPHSHIPALTPLTAGRPIVNGTFTHPSPVAAFLYRGDSGPGAITQLVERLDGQDLFGRPLDTLDAATFNEHARRLGVSAVVALEDDLPRLAALMDNPVFRTRRVEPPFVVWLGPPVTLPEPSGPGRWRIPIEARPGAWTTLPMAYYPLWRARADGRPLATRRGPLDQLEVQAAEGRVVELTYGPGVPELLGVALTVVGVGLGAVAWWGRRRSLSP